MSNINRDKVRGYLASKDPDWNMLFSGTQEMMVDLFIEGYEKCYEDTNKEELKTMIEKLKC